MEYATRHLYFLYTHEPLGECVYKENTSDTWHVSTVSHEKALHNYFIPCLNLWKTYGNFGKSSETSVNFQKLRKCFKFIFEELKRFMKLLKNFINSSKVFSRCFYDFLKSLENLQKSSEVFGNLWKRFLDVIENVHNGSQELKGFRDRF